MYCQVQVSVTCIDDMLVNLIVVRANAIVYQKKLR